jgi:SAM-dependent methyltransferase
MDHQDPVQFFDRLAPDYGQRYAGNPGFHDYYFGERLEKAIRGLHLEGSHVLDIGSGTGDLYTALQPRFPGMHFLASDVSARMLEHSKVPPDQRLVGHIYEHDLGGHTFDAIFMLGVTTYMEPDELDRNLDFVARHLSPKGQFIATFTNRHAIDSWIRGLGKALLPARPGQGGNVLTSGLRIHRYSHGDIGRVLGSRFRIVRWDVLNHTVFPLNRLLPGLSIRLARQLAKTPGAPQWLRPFSSDLMVHATAR